MHGPDMVAGCAAASSCPDYAFDVHPRTRPDCSISMQILQTPRIAQSELWETKVSHFARIDIVTVSINL